MSLEAAKAAARKAATARRATAFAAADESQSRYLCAIVARHPGKAVSGYWPMRSEIDPRPALALAARSAPVGLPVIEAPATPLRFRRWTPETPMTPGPFGAQVPATGDWMAPEIVIVPLLAFSRTGGRLGYGGGFYDRTLERLRDRGPVLAIGYAFAAQEDPDLPLEPTDQPLDLIVTESGIIAP